MIDLLIDLLSTQVIEYQWLFQFPDRKKQGYFPRLRRVNVNFPVPIPEDGPYFHTLLPMPSSLPARFAEDGIELVLVNVRVNRFGIISEGANRGKVSR
jgi:hypothetical protein